VNTMASKIPIWSYPLHRNMWASQTMHHRASPDCASRIPFTKECQRRVPKFPAVWLMFLPHSASASPWTKMLPMRQLAAGAEPTQEQSCHPRPHGNSSTPFNAGR
jgi:hypothetical protein